MLLYLCPSPFTCCASPWRAASHQQLIRLGGPALLLVTQNECVSNIQNPGSAGPTSRFGPCPIFNTSTIVEQGHVDMLEVDDKYDAAMAWFIRKVRGEKV